MSEAKPAPIPAPPPRTPLQKTLRWIARLGIIVLLIPGYSVNVTNGVTTRTFALGLPFSPWIHATQEAGHVGNGERHLMKGGVEFLSVTMLVAVVGFLADWGEKRLRPKPAP